MAEREVSRDVLVACLEATVPLLLFGARADGGTALRERARADAGAIACGGDALFRIDESFTRADLRLPAPDQLTAEQVKAGGVARSYRPAEIYNAVARCVAAGALQPGGVTVFGRHWCTEPHKGCPAGGECR